jgi:hypothetical protein
MSFLHLGNPLSRVFVSMRICPQLESFEMTLCKKKECTNQGRRAHGALDKCWMRAGLDRNQLVNSGQPPFWILPEVNWFGLASVDNYVHDSSGNI